jgi:hypothetical protein
MAKLKAANVELQEKLHRAEREIARGGGDLWDVTDKPIDIAAIMVAKLSPTKAEMVARMIRHLLKEKTGANTVPESYMAKSAEVPVETVKEKFAVLEKQETPAP